MGKAGGRLGCPGPGHELVETRGGPEIDKLGAHAGEVGLRIDALQFAHSDDRDHLRDHPLRSIATSVGRA
jgi:hypothetical protein